MPQLNEPAGGAFAVTPNDSADLAEVTRGVYIADVTSGGALKATMYDGSIVTFTGLLAGTVYPFRCKRIWSTGTTVDTIFGLV